MSKAWDRAKIGWISPEFHGKKTLCFDVKISKEGMFCCNKRQDIAQIMSMLARIMEKLGIDEDEPLGGTERIFELKTKWNCANCGKNLMYEDTFCPQCYKLMERDGNGHNRKGTNSKRKGTNSKRNNWRA